MERLVPWARLLAVLEPFYPQVGPQGGRPTLFPGSDAADPLPAAVELPQ